MRVWWVAVAVLAMPLVQAGTSDAPEVTDPAGDVAGPGGAPLCPAGCNGAPAFVDLVKGWISEEEGQLVFRIDSGNNANAYGAARYEFHFEVAGQTYMAGMLAQPANTANGVPGSGAVTPLGVATTAGWIETWITMTVPYDAVGDPGQGVSITGTYLASRLTVQGQTAATDRAPNAGFGSDYTIAGRVVEAAPTIIHLNVTDGPLEHEFISNATGNASVSINWTAPANVTMDWQLTGNGTANVTIVDAAGVVQYACLCSNGTNVTMDLAGAAGDWHVWLNLTDFDGRSHLVLREMVPAAAAEDMAQPEDNGTAENESLDAVEPQGAPLPLLAPLAALVLAASLRRHRRKA